MPWTKNKLCSATGCARKHLAKGYCSVHYQRVARYGDAQVDNRVIEHHGRTHTPTYFSWRSMNRRCYDLKDQAYARYGGKGIEVCPQWRNSFTQFAKDMGERPPGRTLDRKDNDKGYEPGNCRWATTLEQHENRRVVRRYEGKTIREWAAHFGLYQPSMASYITRHGFPAAIKFYQKKPDLQNPDKAA